MTTKCTWEINASVERCVASLRRALLADGLTVVDAVNISGNGCVALLVDSADLLFEAVALDRGAAVLVPVHVVVMGDGHSSRVHWANPMTVSGLRAPAPARAPIERLCARVRQTLSKLPDNTETTVH